MVNLGMTEKVMVAAPNKTSLYFSGDSITLKSVLSRLICVGLALTHQLAQKAGPALPTVGGRNHRKSMCPKHWANHITDCCRICDNLETKKEVLAKSEFTFPGSAAMHARECPWLKTVSILFPD